MLSEILRTLQRFVRNQPPEGKDDEPGPSRRRSTTITLEPGPTPPPPSASSSAERALSFMREIRRGTRAAIEGEQRQNFAGYSDNLKGKRPKKRSSDSATGGWPARKQTREDTAVWCHRFVCLADRKQTKVPTPTEKTILLASGLGEKPVSFNSLSLTYAETVTVLETIFPKLATAGGIDFLKCPANSREMSLIHLDGASGVPLQLSLKGGHGRIYIRPIQSDLQLLPRESSGADVSSELSGRS